MGWKLKKFCFKLDENEELDKVLVLEKEDRAAIHGIVKFPNGKPVKNAIVKLFKKHCDDPCKLIPVTFAFTDECGQFLFGVKSKKNYCVKVFFFKPEKKCDHDKDRCDLD